MNKEDALTKSKLDLLRERLKGRYPDDNLDDDEAFYGKIGDDYDEFERELSTHREQAQSLSDMFASDPRTANFLQDWRQGEDPIVALVRRFGEDVIRDVLDNPENADKLAEANKEYLSRLSQNKDLETQYEVNITNSFKEIEEMQAQEGLSDDDLEEALSFLSQMSSNLIVGKISPDNIRMVLKALRHDDNVATARHEGTIEGRNTKISEQLRKPQESDGVPHLSSAPVSVPREQKRMTVFDRARLAQ